MSLDFLSPINDAPKYLIEREKKLEQLNTVYRVMDAIDSGSFYDLFSSGSYRFVTTFGKTLCKKVEDRSRDELMHFSDYLDTEEFFYGLVRQVAYDHNHPNSADIRGLMQLINPTFQKFLRECREIVSKYNVDDDDDWFLDLDIPEEQSHQDGKGPRNNSLEQLKWVIPCFQSDYLENWEGSITYLTYTFGYRNRYTTPLGKRRSILSTAIQHMGIDAVVHHLVWLISLKYKSPNEYPLIIRYVDDLEWIETTYNVEFNFN
jgi:hypothetical protein